MKSLVLALYVAGAFQLTVREQARLGVVEIKLHNEYSPTESIAELIDEADLIVRGVVTAAQPRLINDKDIVTDCSVQVLHVFRSSAKGKPEPGRTIVLRQPGGTVAIDGKSITAADPQFPLLQVGDEYFLLLSAGPTGEYIAPRGSQSVFHLSRGKVRQHPGAFSVWNRGRSMPVSQFEKMMSTDLIRGTRGDRPERVSLSRSRCQPR